MPVGLEQQAIYEQAESRRQDRLSRRQSLAGDPRRAEEVEKARLRPVTHRCVCASVSWFVLFLCAFICLILCVCMLADNYKSLPSPPPSTHPSPRAAPDACREGCPTLPPPLTLLPGSGLGAAGEKARVSPAATTAYMTQSIMPQHANTLGITFGGQVRSHLARRRGLLCARWLGRPPAYMTHNIVMCSARHV